MVLEAQLERIEVERDRQLVERRLQREAAARLPRRAHEGGRADVEPDDAMLALDVGAGVEVPRLQGASFDEDVETRGGRGALVRQRGEAAVLARAQRELLARVRPPAHHAEHVRPHQRELHRPPHLLRRHRREQDVRPG